MRKMSFRDHSLLKLAIKQKCGQPHEPLMTSNFTLIHAVKCPLYLSSGKYCIYSASKHRSGFLPSSLKKKIKKKIQPQSYFLKK